MTSIDEASGAFGGNAEQARDLAGGIVSSKTVLDSLIAQTSALGFKTKAEQAQATSDRAEELTGQANNLAEALENIRAQIEALRGLLTKSTTSPGTPDPSIQGPGPTHRGERTRPSHPPDPTRRPGGHPEPVNSGSSSENQVGIRGENEAAIVLARSGYDIAQRPPPKPNGKKPDYFMEGDYWDGYTVLTNNIERVRKSIKDKVDPKDGRPQAQRIVVNLDIEHKGARTTLDKEDIEGIMRRKPLAALKELKVIADGRVHDIDLGE